MAVYNATPQRTNFFSPEDNFFIIDSQNLDSISTKLYGFCIQDNGIYDESNRPEDLKQKLNGRGTYVYVERTGGKITLLQDFVGCYGLYIYNKDGRFVLSNSFLRLSEYLRTRVRLSLNRDYANHFLTFGLSSLSYSHTLLNEVEILPRNAIVNIDIEAAKYELEYIDYHENSIWLNSPEGMEILDRWFTRWTGFFRGLRSVTPNIEADLSGGLDSRMVFVLFSKSGIDLNKVCIRCYQGKNYTFDEDYKMSSGIAAAMGFTLNDESGFTGERLNFSLEDSLRIPFFSKMQTHNQMQHKLSRYENTHFKITGGGGETVRDYWHSRITAKNFMDSMSAHAWAFSGSLRAELRASTKRILQDHIEAINKKTGLPFGEWPSSLFYRETWQRYHHGQEAVESFLANEYKISPLMDWELQSLRLNDPECPDNNLLMATIYERFAPELLNFPFTKNESISQTTRDFARTISAKFPFHTSTPAHDTEFFVRTTDPEVSRLLEHNNPKLEAGSSQKVIKQAFDSLALRKLFATHFDEEICLHAQEYFKRVNHYPISLVHAVVATTKVLRDIMVSETVTGSGVFDDLRSFSEDDYSAASDRLMTGALKAKRFLRKKVLPFPKRVAGKILRLLKLKK